MFDAKKEIRKITKFIQKYFKDNNLKGAVIGISGGKDSAVVAALFTKSLGSGNVIGITMPCHSRKQDMEDAQLVADKYNFELINIDLTETYDTFKKQINKFNIKDDYLINSDINIKPRFRMSTLYYVAAYYSVIKEGTYIVAGTGNKSEEYVGYFTKGGDSISDIKVLSDLTVSEVIAIGKELEVPAKVLYKTPNDGLQQLSDEEKLGITYEDIEKYIKHIEIDKDIKEKIEKLHHNAKHKFFIPTYLK